MHCISVDIFFIRGAKGYSKCLAGRQNNDTVVADTFSVTCPAFCQTFQVPKLMTYWIQIHLSFCFCATSVLWLQLPLCKYSITAYIWQLH